MACVNIADTAVEARSSVHWTAISPLAARTTQAGSSRSMRPGAVVSVSTTMAGAGQIPSSVRINAPLASTFSMQPRHLQPLSRACKHLSLTGILVDSRWPQRCSIDCSANLIRGHASPFLVARPYALVRTGRPSARRLRVGQRTQGRIAAIRPAHLAKVRSAGRAKFGGR